MAKEKQIVIEWRKKTEDEDWVERLNRRGREASQLRKAAGVEDSKNNLENK